MLDQDKVIKIPVLTRIAKEAENKEPEPQNKNG